MTRQRNKTSNTLELPDDTFLLKDVLGPKLANTIFDDLQSELSSCWSEMYHKGGAVPRLVCIQGQVERTVDKDGNVTTVEPIYRHPADEQPPLQAWTPTVQRLREIVSSSIKQPLNHALIQLYRSGDDYISEHADKTIDVHRGSAIVNLSLGASRTMVLRPKKDPKLKQQETGQPSSRPSCRIELPHASLFVLGWETNAAMTHEIRRDKRADKFKSAAELDFKGCRLSLTFRNVATFLQQPSGLLVGQGAPSSNAPGQYETQALEEEALIKAFSEENRCASFDWDKWYGNGFSVVNFKTINQQQKQSEASAADALGKNENGLVPKTEAAPLNGNIALLAIDLQNDFVGDSPFFLATNQPRNSVQKNRDVLLRRIGKLAEQVRNAEGQVIFIKSLYGEIPEKSKEPYPHSEAREGLPFNTEFHQGSHFGKHPCCVRGTKGASLHPGALKILQDGNDLVVEKNYYSSFTRTTLHSILQQRCITTILVCGVTTNNCVAATIKDAFHLGYNVILSEDGTSTTNAANQIKTIEELRPYCSVVLKPRQSLASVFEVKEKQAEKGQNGGSAQPKAITFDGKECVTGLGCGDSILVPSFLAELEADQILQRLLVCEKHENSGISKDGGEFEWNQLRHLPTGSKLPRLTAYQSSRNDNGHLPSYRCADPQPYHGQYDTREWTPTIARLKMLAEEKARHGFNWSRILLYRDEKDGMGFHSDKCLDLRHESFIASVSLGETRVYELKPKEGVGAAMAPQRITLRHNTLLLLGPKTNQYYTHSIKKGGAAGPRVSVTFRDLATYYVDSETYPAFYGQGTEHECFDDLKTSLWRRKMYEGLSLGLLGMMGFFVAPNRKTTNRVGIAGVAVAAGSLVASLLREREWNNRQKLLGRVYQLCNVLPLSSHEAREIATNETFWRNIAQLQTRKIQVGYERLR